METYHQNYSVLASDMDFTYHITPVAIMLYFQDSFARFLTSKRVAAFDIIKEHLIWVISDFEVNFVGPRPFWSSTIGVTLRFTEISTVRIYVDFEITDESGRVFARGTSVWAILNSETKRPVAAPALLEAAGITATGPSVGRISVPKMTDLTPVTQVEHTVNVTDLDFNGHVCNRTYLAISLATQPVSFIENYTPRHLHLRFLRESFFGEKLNIHILHEGNEKYGYDIVNEKGKSICTVYSEWKYVPEEERADISACLER